MKKSYIASLFSLGIVFAVVLFSFPEVTAAIWLPEQFPGVTVNSAGGEGMVLGVTTGPDTLSGNQLSVAGEAYIGSNLGIGTRNPGGKLDVAGNVYILSNGRYYSFGGARSDGGSDGSSDSGSYLNDGSFAIRDTWRHRDLLRIDRIGNIELGNSADLGVRKPADVTVFGMLRAQGSDYQKNTYIQGGKVLIEEELTVGTTTINGNSDLPSTFLNGLEVNYSNRFRSNLLLVRRGEGEKGTSISFSGALSGYRKDWNIGTDDNGNFFLNPSGWNDWQNRIGQIGFSANNPIQNINMPGVNLNLPQGTVTAKNICTLDGVCLRSGSSTNISSNTSNESVGNTINANLSGTAGTSGNFTGGEGYLFRNFSVQCPEGKVMVGMNVRQNIAQYYPNSGSIRDNYQFQPICQ